MPFMHSLFSKPAPAPTVQALSLIPRGRCTGRSFIVFRFTMMVAYRTLCRRGTVAVQRLAPRGASLCASNDHPILFRPQLAAHIAYVRCNSTESGTKAAQRPRQRKRLDVAIVGAPNAGKSQLLNSLIGKKVAAVSRKRHTTRSGILGAITLDDVQLVFIDTPGFLHHKMGVKEGVRKLMGEASSEMDCSDYTLLVVDAAKNLDEDAQRTIITLVFLALRSRGRNEDGARTRNAPENEPLNKLAVVMNKVDLVTPKTKLLMAVAKVSSLAESCVRQLLNQRRNPAKVRLGDMVESVLKNHEDETGFDNIHEDDIETFAAVIPQFLFTSAITADDEGVDDVLGLLLDRATPSKMWLVDAESTSGMTPVEQVEEIIREKIYRCLHREVPHCVEQSNRMFKTIKQKKQAVGSHEAEREDKLLRIHQDLVVRTKSHQKLVLGSGGKTLERIRSTALNDLEDVFECEVDLQLNVRLTKLNQQVQLESDGEGSNMFTTEKD